MGILLETGSMFSETVVSVTGWVFVSLLTFSLDTSSSGVSSFTTFALVGTDICQLKNEKDKI